MGLVEDVTVGLCVTVKTKVCNYGMVELMFWWLGATMLLFILGHRESERKRPVWRKAKKRKNMKIMNK